MLMTTTRRGHSRPRAECRFSPRARRRRAAFLGHGRFMQPDPLGYSDGLNPYSYVGGDPVNFRDPTGTEVDCNPLGCIEQQDIVVTARRGGGLEFDLSRFNLDLLFGREGSLGGEFTYINGHAEPSPVRRPERSCPVGYTQYSVGIGATAALGVGIMPSLQIGISVPNAPTLVGTQFFATAQVSGTLGAGGFVGAGLSASAAESSSPYQVLSASSHAYAEGSLGYGASISLSRQWSASGSATSSGLPVPRLGAGYGAYAGVGAGGSVTAATRPFGCRN